MRSFGAGVDDCVKINMSHLGKRGEQCIKINDQELGMNVDAWKYYFRAQNPTHKDLNKSPIIESTSPLSYENQHHYSRCLHTSKIDLEDWMPRLRYPTYEITKLTVQNTTLVIKSLKSETN